MNEAEDDLKNYAHSPLTNKKRTGAKMLPAIDSGIVTGGRAGQLLGSLSNNDGGGYENVN